MSIFFEFITVIVKKKSLEEKVQNWVDHCKYRWPALRMDDYLVAAGFMAPDYVRDFIEELTSLGLTFLDADNYSVDIAVIGEFGGGTYCDWIETGPVTPDSSPNICWMAGTEPGHVCTIKGREIHGYHIGNGIRVFELDKPFDMPTFIEEHHKAFQTFRSQEEYQAALHLIDLIIEMDPSSPHFYNDRGNINKLRGSHNEAVKDFSNAISLDQEFSRAYFNRSVAWEAAGNTEAALKDARSAHMYRRSTAYEKRINMLEDALVSSNS